MPENEEIPFATEEETDDEPYAPSYEINEREVYTTPADPDVETLLNRIEAKHLILRPDFQRASVWTVKQKSRLIESLLLNLPIPPCFLAEDEDGTRVVVDGQQRIGAIDDFYHGRFALTDLQVLKDLNGSTWSTLPPKLDRKILQRVVRTLVISQHSNPGIRFEIFERLNTGGEPLTEQEIRNATLRGSFNALLNKLAKSPQFLSAVGAGKADARLRHHELILRFFAVKDAIGDYKPPLKMILSEFMRKNRRANDAEIAEFERMFITALENSHLAFGGNEFRKFRIKQDAPAYESAISKAVFELQMISLSFLAPTDCSARAVEIKRSFEELSLQSQEFVESLSRATDHRTRFYKRLRLWSEKLLSIGLGDRLSRALPRNTDTEQG